MIFESARSIQLVTGNKTVTLVAPIIGLDFVAGLDSTLADWVCFAMKNILRISKIESNDDELPLLRFQPIPLTDFIKTIERPMRLVCDRDAFNILAIDENFLVAENQTVIPLASISELRMIGAN